MVQEKEENNNSHRTFGLEILLFLLRLTVFWIVVVAPRLILSLVACPAIVIGVGEVLPWRRSTPFLAQVRFYPKDRRRKSGFYCILVVPVPTLFPHLRPKRPTPAPTIEGMPAEKLPLFESSV
jgi:hypothetical protein